MSSRAQKDFAKRRETFDLDECAFQLECAGAMAVVLHDALKANENSHGYAEAAFGLSLLLGHIQNDAQKAAQERAAM